MLHSNLSRVLLATVGGLAATATIAAPAMASTRPPTPASSLFGTWVNTNAATRSVKQIVLQRSGTGDLLVDGFGACTPSLCEWGLVPAISYGTSVSATTGPTFQSNQRFLSGTSEFSRTAMFGTVTSTTLGLRLKVQELTVFTDGSGRRNYTTTETFVLGKGQAPARKGLPVGDYPQGRPPAPVGGLFGSWKNVSATPGLVSMKISNGGGIPLVQAFGACSPTPCDLGVVKGVTYGTSISSATGATVLAPYSFGFKKEQLIIGYGRTSTGRETLTVANYNEFTDSSGRSNYNKTERFVRA